MYSSLNSSRREIRLIELEAGEFDDAIRCVLKVVSLDEHPVYEALSYVWGDPNVREPITVNGIATDVTMNLKLALRYLRKANAARIIWIDAICINQADTAEKNRQVRMMRNIYEEAAEVVVWLGDADEDSELVFPLLPSMAEKLRSHDLGYTFANEHTNAELATFKLDVFHRQSAVAFSRFLSLRPWFSRVWIVQEHAVAQVCTFYCGSRMVSSDDFWDAAKLNCLHANYLGYGSSIPLNVIFAPLVIRSRSHQNQSLHHILSVCRLQLATDPRDKVFALYGLSEEAQRGPRHVDVIIDYSLPVHKVYLSLATGLLEQDGNLDIFGHAGLRPSPRVSQLPSWVPDWTDGARSAPLIQRLDHDELGMSFAACWPSASWTPRYLLDGNALVLRGFMFDTIVGVGLVPYIDDRVPPSHISGAFNLWRHGVKMSTEGLDVYCSWRRLAGVSASAAYPTGESRLEAFWQTLQGGVEDSDRDRLREMFAKFERRELWLVRLWPYVRWCPPLRPISTWNDSLLRKKLARGSKDDYADFFAESSAVINRRIFVTSNGYIGIGHRETAVGDSVAICEGGHVPLVLRRADEALESWRLVCESYVHGIMYGEAFEADRCTNIILV